MFQLHEPFCQPFGNRRLLHCREADSPDVDKEGELLAWESCGRIVAKERADFFEFVVNTLCSPAPTTSQLCLCRLAMPHLRFWASWCC